MAGHMRVPRQAYFVFVAALLLALPAESATLTITITGQNSGNVSARPAGTTPGGGLCFGTQDPDDSNTCAISFPDGTVVRVMANSPNTPGLISNGTDDAATCGTSTCEFTLNNDSSLLVTFDSDNAPLFRTIQIDLLGGDGEVSTDHNRCQDWELGFTGRNRSPSENGCDVLAAAAAPGSPGATDTFWRYNE